MLFAAVHESALGWHWVHGLSPEVKASINGRDPRPSNLNCEPPSGGFFFVRYLFDRTLASFRRSAVHAIPAPIKITASVALKLPGAMQLIQLVTSVGTSIIWHLSRNHTRVRWDLRFSSQPLMRRSRQTKGADFPCWHETDIVRCPL
jgi:hypothetical protein